jgi:hypothetical protein
LHKHIEAMPQPSTLSYVADLVINRVLANVDGNTNIELALEEAYPFDDSVDARRIWLQAVLRHALEMKERAKDRVSERADAA